MSYCKGKAETTDFAARILVGVTAFVATIGASADEPKQEVIPVQLRGEWVLVSAEEGGKVKNYTDRHIAFDEMEYRFYVRDLVVRKAHVLSNLSAKPAEMDQRHHFGPNKGKVMKCIFKLEGDTLTIASGLYDADRPSGFDSSKPGCSSVTVWKRTNK